LQRCITELHAFDPTKVEKRYREPDVMRLEAAIDEALSAAFGHRTPAYNRYGDAATLDHGPHTARTGGSWSGDYEVNYDLQDAIEARRYFAEGKQQSIVLLQQAIRTLEDEIGDQEQEEQATAPRFFPTKVSHGRKVFLVHGHDESALQTVARFLEKIGLEAIILREQPDAGRTIIEKFEGCASEVGFAVVLLTPDDLGGVDMEPATIFRARQNVIFELGYFAGKLGRGRVCLMRAGPIEIPSDLHGVIYTELDAAEGWKLKLIKELKAANLEFDANRMWE
jgi:predicted nucleotide-binding protein